MRMEMPSYSAHPRYILGRFAPVFDLLRQRKGGSKVSSRYPTESRRAAVTNELERQYIHDAFQMMDDTEAGGNNGSCCCNRILSSIMTGFQALQCSLNRPIIYAQKFCPLCSSYLIDSGP